MVYKKHHGCSFPSCIGINMEPESLYLIGSKKLRIALTFSVLEKDEKDGEDNLLLAIIEFLEA